MLYCDCAENGGRAADMILVRMGEHGVVKRRCSCADVGGKPVGIRACSRVDQHASRIRQDQGGISLPHVNEMHLDHARRRGRIREITRYVQKSGGNYCESRSYRNSCRSELSCLFIYRRDPSFHPTTPPSGEFYRLRTKFRSPRRYGRPEYREDTTARSTAGISARRR